MLRHYARSEPLRPEKMNGEVAVTERAFVKNSRALEAVRALAFDVQGTCVDFYQPILRMGQAVNQAKGLDIDWATLSSEWRDLYRRALDQVIAGQRPWLRVDRIYREALDTLLERAGLSAAFTTVERDKLNQIWTRLDPWPDAVEGLARLRRGFVTSTLSNAGMAAVVAVVKHAGLPFDAVLTAELAHSYKPAPAVYQLAVDYLGYRPDEILMVACHKYDLKAARAFGMRTAFVARGLEFGPGAKVDTGSETWFDIYTDSFVALASALGV
jgi:2-haloacid dehalogenase